MCSKKDYIENEKEDLKRIKVSLKNLKAKWFKTFKIDERIKFLEKYIEIKSDAIYRLEKI